MQAIQDFAGARGWKINKNIYLEDSNVDDIVKMRFNPAGGLAEFCLAAKGLSILALRPNTVTMVEDIKKMERARKSMEGNRTLAEELQLEKGDPPAPAVDFDGLQLNITSWCAMLGALFGEGCGYFRDVRGWVANLGEALRITDQK